MDYSPTFVWGTFAFILLLVVLGVPRHIIPWLLGLEIALLALVGAI